MDAAMVTYQDWKEEQEKLARLRRTVDRLAGEITEGLLVGDETELRRRIGLARELCQKLFPDRLELFDLIYPARFLRLFRQFGRSTKSWEPEK